MEKLIFILIISFLFSSCSIVKKYNITNYNSIELKEESACLCFQLPKETQKDESFYLEMISEEKGAKIDKSLSYYFVDSCDNKKECDGNSYLFKLKNDKPNLETESNGFYYEYLFKVDDNNHKGLMIFYKSFTGNKVTIHLVPFGMGDIFKFLGIFVLILITFIILIIICCCKCCKRRKKNLPVVEFQNTYGYGNPQNLPIINDENNLNSQKLIELRHY